MAIALFWLVEARGSHVRKTRTIRGQALTLMRSICSIASKDRGKGFRRHWAVVDRCKQASWLAIIFFALEEWRIRYVALLLYYPALLPVFVVGSLPDVACTSRAEN